MNESTSKQKCSTCGGDGRSIVDGVDYGVACPKCGGKGHEDYDTDGDAGVLMYKCSACNGTGKATSAVVHQKPAPAPKNDHKTGAKTGEASTGQEDMVLKMCEKYEKSMQIMNRGYMIDAIRTAYLENIARRDEVYNRDVVEVIRGVDAFWVPRVEKFKQMIAGLESRCAELQRGKDEAFDRVAELEAQLNREHKTLADALCGDDRKTEFGDVIPYAVSAIKNATQPSDGRDFERMVDRISEGNIAENCVLSDLIICHNADRAADRAEIERLKADKVELVEALLSARDDFSGLPHSLGYDLTHLPKIDELIAKHTEAHP